MATKSFSRRDILSLGVGGFGSLLVPLGMRTIASAAEVATGSQETPGPTTTPALVQTKGIFPQVGCLIGFERQYLYPEMFVSTDYDKAEFNQYFGQVKTLEDMNRSGRQYWDTKKKVGAEFPR